MSRIGFGMSSAAFRLLAVSRILSGFRSRSTGVGSTVTGSTPSQFDIVVVGGGIIGCATARQLKISNPELKIALLEKEEHLAPHQSGHNSGVLHAGIYYAPGSLKAKLCVRGIDLAYKYCDEHKIPYKKTGKLIVAVEPMEVPRLEGLKALWSPHTGIVDWGLVTKSYAKSFEKRGGFVYTKHPLKRLSLSKIHCKYVITCCGLQSDRVAKLSGGTLEPKIVPFRGEYLLLTSESKKKLVTTNIYPVPNPHLPFLGVHFTPRMNGDVWLGPNAVLAYKREGYSYFQVSLFDLYDTLAYRGTRRLIYKFFGHGMKELYRGIWIRAQVKQLQRFMPDLRISDVKRGPAGVRAQALDPNGDLVDDFIFDSGQGELSQFVLHVRNAPSPGATSSLAIAEMISEKASTVFGLRH
uniref:L-2-hydroxyglutarate dehydrogenase, mitochondrial n=1 Tax=Setaria digitata TaxID=48799 RepID=A0A915PLT7_9BILA